MGRELSFADHVKALEEGSSQSTLPEAKRPDDAPGQHFLSPEFTKQWWQTLKRGDTVWWNDPDDTNEGYDRSGVGEIAEINSPEEGIDEDTIIFLNMINPVGETEALPTELEPLTKQEEAKRPPKDPDQSELFLDNYEWARSPTRYHAFYPAQLSVYQIFHYLFPGNTDESARIRDAFQYALGDQPHISTRLGEISEQLDDELLNIILDGWRRYKGQHPELGEAKRPTDPDQQDLFQHSYPEWESYEVALQDLKDSGWVDVYGDTELPGRGHFQFPGYAGFEIFEPSAFTTIHRDTRIYAYHPQDEDDDTKYIDEVSGVAAEVYKEVPELQSQLLSEKDYPGVPEVQSERTDTGIEQTG